MEENVEGRMGVDASDGGCGDEEEELVLTCSHCAHIICGAGDIIQEAHPTLTSAVYTYELDVLDVECHCYSATNPTDNRFDVVRVRQCRGALLRGLPSPEHSWFPPFSWNFAMCGACGAHLGWGFEPPGGEHHENGQQQQRRGINDEGAEERGEGAGGLGSARPVGSSEAVFALGDEIEAVGLVNATHLNGLRGVVVAVLDTASGRVAVEIEGHGHKLIKPQNLVVAIGREPDDAPAASAPAVLDQRPAVENADALRLPFVGLIVTHLRQSKTPRGQPPPATAPAG